VRRRTLVLACLFLACQRKAAPTGEPATEKPAVAARATDGGVVPGGRGVGVDAGAETPQSALERTVIHVPDGLAPNEKVPLLVVLHGLGASSSGIVKHSDWRSFAKQKRIAWVTPDGPKDTLGRQFWNAGSSCCDFDASEADHVAAFRGLIVRATTHHPVDAKRVYFVGYSNGGFMAHRIACELGDLVSGIVSVAGAGPKDPCPAAAPVRVLQVHGDADEVVVIGGGPLFRDPKYPTHLSAERTVADWAKRYDCKSEPTEVSSTIDFDDGISGAETKIRRFHGCKRGAVELWTVTGGDHFVGMRAPAQEAMWRFLSGG
jgi:polyhydroxybutyrate depolymerase